MEKKHRKYVPLGKFTLTGDMLRVTDPCSTETWCAGVIEDMKSGEYNAYAAYDDGGRIEMLLVAHSTCTNAHEMADKISTYDDDKIEYSYWEEIDAVILADVHSGQCGLFDEEKIFDATQYYGFESRKSRCDNTLYTNCCALTSSSMQAGVMPCGAVSSNECCDIVLAFVLRDDDDIGVAACIVYA